MNPFTEEPVRFESRGKRLFGIFHPAANGSPEYGIVFANSGMQNRVGPHRLYVSFARILSRAGYNVLRIDFPGIGESEGTVTETHFDAHDPEDTLSAIDYLREDRKIRRIALFGLCAGARNAIKAGSRDHRVDRVVLWSLPIVWISASFPAPNREDPRGWMSRTGAVLTFKGKVRKALSVTGWKRFLANGGNLKVIFLDLRSILWNLVSNEEKWTRRRHSEFFAAFSGYIRSGRPALFLYGERDEILIEEFGEMFHKHCGASRNACDLVVIPNGNHSFTSIETQEQAIAETMEWLSQWSGTKSEPSRPEVSSATR